MLLSQNSNSSPPNKLVIIPTLEVTIIVYDWNIMECHHYTSLSNSKLRVIMLIDSSQQQWGYLYQEISKCSNWGHPFLILGWLSDNSQHTTSWQKVFPPSPLSTHKHCTPLTLVRNYVTCVFILSTNPQAQSKHFSSSCFKRSFVGLGRLYSHIYSSSVPSSFQSRFEFYNNTVLAFGICYLRK